MRVALDAREAEAIGYIHRLIHKIFGIEGLHTFQEQLVIGLFGREYSDLDAAMG